jgi:DNA-directed RNA polymerase specialized sigma24 family protein
LTRGQLDADAERLLRDLAPHVLGSIVRRFRDFAAAEDAVQEALVAAAMQWPSDGLPDHPRAWLIQVAARRLVDQQRSESARRQRESAAATPFDEVAPTIDCAEDAEDDTLILLFMCAHPALTTSSAIALTLRAVVGLTTAEIANRGRWNAAYALAEKCRHCSLRKKSEIGAVLRLFQEDWSRLRSTNPSRSTFGRSVRRRCRTSRQTLRIALVFRIRSMLTRSTTDFE